MKLTIDGNFVIDGNYHGNLGFDWLLSPVTMVLAMVPAMVLAIDGKVTIDGKFYAMGPDIHFRAPMCPVCLWALLLAVGGQVTSTTPLPPCSPPSLLPYPSPSPPPSPSLLTSPPFTHPSLHPPLTPSLPPPPPSFPHPLPSPTPPSFPHPPPPSFPKPPMIRCPVTGSNLMWITGFQWVVGPWFESSSNENFGKSSPILSS